MKCRACPAEITWAINLDTQKRVPLVPAQEGAKVRYRMNDRGYCAKDPEGAWMSHFENCPGANQFHKESQEAWEECGCQTRDGGLIFVQKAGVGSTQTAGGYSTQTAGYGSNQSAGFCSTQTAGSWSTQKAGDKSTQKAGDESTQMAGGYSTQTAGFRSTQMAGEGSRHRAGQNSVLICRYREDGVRRVSVAIVGEDIEDDGKRWSFNTATKRWEHSKDQSEPGAADIALPGESAADALARIRTETPITKPIETEP